MEFDSLGNIIKKKKDDTSDDTEPKPMSVKERMKMFNKKKKFKVETQSDALRRQKKTKSADKKAAQGMFLFSSLSLFTLQEI